MSALIEKIRAIREPVRTSIRGYYGRKEKLKVRHVIATKNIEWSDADLSKCKEAQIAVITDGEINYYAALVKHLRHAARYQFLAHMFRGQKIDGLAACRTEVRENGCGRIAMWRGHGIERLS